jgi:type IV pilus assembly protein PilV
MGKTFESIERAAEGFTLIEVLVAVIILAVALLGMGTLTTSIIANNHYADQVSSATTLAQDKLEELKSEDYSALSTSSDTQSIYTRTWVVVTDSPEPGTKTITVNVSWGRKGKTRNVVLKTIVTN